MSKKSAHKLAFDIEVEILKALEFSPMVVSTIELTETLLRLAEKDFGVQTETLSKNYAETLIQEQLKRSVTSGPMEGNVQGQQHSKWDIAWQGVELVLKHRVLDLDRVSWRLYRDHITQEVAETEITEHAEYKG